MHPVEELEVLHSMEILVDTREKSTERALRRYESFGCPYRRCTLVYGDYTFNAILPDGNSICNISYTVAPSCVIERKMSLDELAACFCKGRERFTKELERAKKKNAKVYLIVENGSLDMLIQGKYTSKLNPKDFFTLYTKYIAKYDLSVHFCNEESTGTLIHEILYRELKERIERGDYG